MPYLPQIQRQILTPGLGKWATLLWLSLATLLAMGTWFSASAVVPALTTAGNLDQAGRAWLTMSVQLGFVVGALGSALLNLADRVPARRLFTIAALLAAAATALVPIASSFTVALSLRFLTGLALVGVYPVAMRLVTTWTRADRGLGIGRLVGAITLGNAMAQLLTALGGAEDWRWVLCAAAGLGRARGSARDPRSALRLALRGSNPAAARTGSGQPWLPRSYVGTVRHAGLAPSVPRGQLPGERPRPDLGQPDRICRH